MTLHLRGRVSGRHIVVDDEVDLPEGAEVTLTLVDMGDDLDDAERAALREEINLSLDEAARGETISAEESLQRLRTRHG